MAFRPAHLPRFDRQCPPERQVQLALVGDVMLGRHVNEALRVFGPRYPWGNTLHLLRQADVALANMECVVADDGVPWQRTLKTFHFRADPIAVTALQVAGIDAVGLANNHVLDFEVGALLETLDRLDAARIARAGAGRDLAEAARAAFINVCGVRVALIAFTDNEPGWAATATGSGINYIPIIPDQRHLSLVRHSIDVARSGGADLVVCFAHWGPNMRQRPTPVFREFARMVLEAGADLYCGHSAHIFQGIELHLGKPILYDIGDFVDDYAVDPALRNDQSLLFTITMTKQGVWRLEAVPVRIHNCQANLAAGDDFAPIAARLRSLSAEFGTEVQVVDRCLRIVVERKAIGA